jgi:hypothetical protein
MGVRTGKILVDSRAKLEEGPSYKFPLTPEQIEKSHKVTVGVPDLSIFMIGARSPFNANPSHGQFVEYSTPPAFQDDVIATYSFNNHSLLRFHETIKDAIDPKRYSGRRAVRDLAQGDEEKEGLAMIGSKKRLAALLGLLAFAPAALAQTSTDAQLKKGHEVYQYWCWNCHGSGAGKPGTDALRAKYKDARPADLEQRTDLLPAVTKTFVRKGVSIMPCSAKQKSVMRNWMHWRPI